MTLTASHNATPTTTVMERLHLTPKVKTPETLVADALASFTQAEAKLTAAVDEIARQENALLAQREQLDTKIGQAQEAKSRLGRISQRIVDLLA